MFPVLSSLYFSSFCSITIYCCYKYYIWAKNLLLSVPCKFFLLLQMLIKTFGILMSFPKHWIFSHLVLYNTAHSICFILLFVCVNLTLNSENTFLLLFSFNNLELSLLLQGRNIVDTTYASVQTSWLLCLANSILRG